MRTLSKFEKEVVAYLCSIKSLSKDVAISDIITRFCPCSLKWDDNSITIFFDTNKYQTDYVLNRLMTVICLFEYLQYQSLIYVFKRTNVADRKELINVRLNHTKWGDDNINEEREISIEGGHKFIISGKTYIFGDKATGVNSLDKVNVPWNFTQLVDRYANSVVFCTETLHSIKKHFYLDQPIRISLVAIFISLCVGLLSGVASFITYCQSERQHQESMSQSQKIVIVHDTIIQADKPIVQKVTTLKSTVLDNALKPSTANPK